MTVRNLTPEDLAQSQAIVRGLPDYFTDDVPEKVQHDLELHGGWALTDGKDVVAFAIVDQRSPRSAEILWMAVRADRRHRGLGRTLLAHVLHVLHTHDVKLVEVKTLDASAAYAPYRATRGFWERNGFVQVDAIDPLPGWQPGNPAAIYVCALGSTR
jgi:GNAT superfamily N-acetyltransferase